jgi:hypothetical protein
MRTGIIKCPACSYEMANMDTFKFLGHPAEYWIDLQVKAETLSVSDLMTENIQLKAKLYNMDLIAKSIAEVLTK